MEKAAADEVLDARLEFPSEAQDQRDRRIVRTEKALRRAFVELVEERGLDGFTLNEMCSRAKVNRATFYNHYKDRADFVDALEDEFFADLEGFQSQLGQLSLKGVMRIALLKKPLPFLVDLFDYLRGQGAFIHAMLGPNGDPRFAPRLRDSIFTNFVELILHEHYRGSDDPFVGYYVSFFASAYLGVVTRWVDEGMLEDSETMSRVCIRLLLIKPGEKIRL